MRIIEKIVLHCSDSAFGDAATINQWHIERGFKKIGYHYVILNGYRTSSNYRSRKMDCIVGEVEIGRELSEIGAHVAGHNRNSIGICLIGNTVFSEAQLEAARRLIVDKLLQQFPGAKLLGHHELDPKKTCPNLEMIQLRKQWGITV
ncbi:MAG: N-acetylmuramoyl-L-alanine amidase [bacterium]|nr:N-acetylmuramoyl-L-alanine amidase [bacterium]